MNKVCSNCDSLYSSGVLLNLKMSYQYKDAYVKDTTVSRPSYL